MLGIVSSCVHLYTHIWWLIQLGWEKLWNTHRHYASITWILHHKISIRLLTHSLTASQVQVLGPLSHEYYITKFRYDNPPITLHTYSMAHPNWLREVMKDSSTIFSKFLGPLSHEYYITKFLRQFFQNSRTYHMNTTSQNFH